LPDADPELLQVLNAAWTSPFTTRSDTARRHADLIAEAACRGLITIKSHDQQWGRTWRITACGLTLLENTP
jgi:hypothetical protein